MNAAKNSPMEGLLLVTVIHIIRNWAVARSHVASAVKLLEVAARNRSTYVSIRVRDPMGVGFVGKPLLTAVR